MRIKNNDRNYSMESVYEMVGCSRQSVHQFNKVRTNRKVAEKQIIESVHHWRKIHPRMGSRTLYYTMKNIGGIDLGMGVNKFENLMSREGLTIKKRKKKWIKTSDGLGKSHYVNLTNGLVLNGINQLIVGDITYYEIGGSHCYIFTLKDVYSQRILSLVPAMTLEGRHALQCLENALKQRKDTDICGCIHHSDNGSQYNANEYVKRILKSGMVISRARNCTENGSAEHLNGLVKNMYLRPWQIDTFKDLEKACSELIVVNNEKRSIEQLGNLSPHQFEQVVEQLPKEDRPKKKLYDFDS